jgi:hypothetical protein
MLSASATDEPPYFCTIRPEEALGVTRAGEAFGITRPGDAFGVARPTPPPSHFSSAVNSRPSSCQLRRLKYWTT